MRRDDLGVPAAGGATSSTGYPMLFRNLMAVCLLADAYGLREQADDIGRAVDGAIADATAFHTFRLIARGIAGDVQQVNSEVDAGLDTAANDAVRVGMAVALALAGDPKWQQVVDRVLASSDDVDVRSTARNVAQYVKMIHSLSRGKSAFDYAPACAGE